MNLQKWIRRSNLNKTNEILLEKNKTLYNALNRLNIKQ